MDDIYDTPDMEPSLVATLAVLREPGPAPQPNESMHEAAKAVSSAPLAAFAHTLGGYLSGPDFGAFELNAELAENDLDDWAEPLQEAGCDLQQSLLIGTTGSGDECMFMAAEDTSAGYAIFLWAMDGQPYERSGEPLFRVGLFSDLFRFLADRSDGQLDEQFRAIA